MVDEIKTLPERCIFPLSHLFGKFNNEEHKETTDRQGAFFNNLTKVLYKNGDMVAKMNSTESSYNHELVHDIKQMMQSAQLATEELQRTKPENETVKQSIIYGLKLEHIKNYNRLIFLL